MSCQVTEYSKRRCEYAIFCQIKMSTVNCHISEWWEIHSKNKIPAVFKWIFFGKTLRLYFKNREEILQKGIIVKSKFIFRPKIPKNSVLHMAGNSNITSWKHNFSSGGRQEYSIIPMFLPSEIGFLFVFYPIRNLTNLSGVQTSFGPKGQKNRQCIFWSFDKANVLSETISNDAHFLFSPIM